jgi:hypothetical protein
MPNEPLQIVHVNLTVAIDVRVPAEAALDARSAA